MCESHWTVCGIDILIVTQSLAAGRSSVHWKYSCLIEIIYMDVKGTHSTFTSLPY